MAITEESRHDMYEGLTEALGKRRATTLMEHLPPVGWADVATKQDIEALRVDTQRDLQLAKDELRQELGGDIARLRTEMEVGFANVGTEFANVGTEFANVGTEFANVGTEFAKLRGELDTLRGGMDTLRGEMATGFADIRADLHTTLHRHTFALLTLTVALIGVMAAVLHATG